MLIKKLRMMPAKGGEKMSRKVKVSVLFSYLFFLIYFITYIGEKTNIKYLAIILYELYVFKRVGFGKVKTKDRNIKIICVLIIFSLSLSLLVNFNIGGAIKTISLIDLFIFAFFIMPQWYEVVGFDERKFIKIITDSLFVGLFIAFITQYNNVIIPIGRSSGASVRHLFGLGNASVVGFLCFLEFTLSFFGLCVEKKRMRNLIRTFAKIGISVYMAYLADIRASLVSMLFFLLLYVYSRLPKKRNIVVFEISIVSLMVVLGIIFLEHIPLNENTLNYIFSDRFKYYSKAISEIVNSKAILFGAGAFRNSEVLSLKRVQIDNSFLDIFYQYGILCMIFLAILILYMLKKMFVINKKNVNCYHKFISSYYISVLVYSMVEKNLFSISSGLGLITFLLMFWYLEKYRNIG